MGAELTNRCAICRCYVDQDDLFCGNCGTENETVKTKTKSLTHAVDHHSFDCDACGASMSYDASAQNLRCPFCGSENMRRTQSAQRTQPNAVVAFRVDRERAESVLRSWLGKGFWRPADAARAATIGKMAAVYVPYWVFEATTDTRWTADSSPAPFGSRGDWYPLTGQNAASYRGLLIAGSSVLTAQETNSIAPFDISKALEPAAVDLENAISEEFRVPRKMARPLARGLIEQREVESCSRQVPNRHRNVKVNVQISAMEGEPVLLPVWVLAYRYRDKVHRVLINGQSARIAGSAPFSYAKLGLVLLIGVGIVAVIAAIAIGVSMASG